MDLEQTAKQLVFLAREDDLSPPDHQRAKALMRELRKLAMTNAQISELTEGRWAETTIKEYTRGVTVMDSQRWQSTTALFGEMLSKGISTEDVKETIALRDKLEGGSTSLAEITDLLTDLKRAGTDIGGLVVLYRQWGASGLTVSEATSALKYKGEIEGIGFGLDSLSDVAGAAKVLGNPRDVLEAIGKYRDVTELDNELKAAQGRLADEETRIKERIEEGEQAIREVEKREESARERLTQIDQQVNAKDQLLRKAGELGELGLDTTRLSDLCTTVSGMGVKHGLGRQEALNRFFDELKEYDAALGFEAEAERWATIAETNKLQSEKIKAQLEALEMRYKERKEAVDAMESLLKQGIKPAQISLYNRILSKFKGPEHFEEELEHYQGIEGLLNARDKEVKHRESKIAELDTQLKALKQELAEIKNSIKVLKNSGVENITKISDSIMGNLQTLAEETTRWGKLKEEAGKLGKELMCARFLTTSDQAIIKSFPKELVLAFLERVVIYCKLKGLNPVVKMPDGISRKFPLVYGAGEVTLLEIIAWAEAGLAGVLQ